MSANTTQKPYRSACGVRQCLTAPKYRHAIARVIADKFVNTTNAKYLSGCGVGYFFKQPPISYEYNQDACGAASCGVGIGPCGACTGDEPDLKLVDAGYGYHPVIPADSAPGTLAGNTFTKDGTVDLTACRELGFKNVQASKTWHGTFGLLHNCDGDGANSDTKYLGYSCSFLGKYQHYASLNGSRLTISDITYSGNSGWSVNRYSGIISGSSQIKMDNYNINYDIDFDGCTLVPKPTEHVEHFDSCGSPGDNYTIDPCWADLLGQYADELRAFPSCQNDTPAMDSGVLCKPIPSNIIQMVLSWTTFSKTNSGWSSSGTHDESSSAGISKWDWAINVSRSNTGYTASLTLDYTYLDFAPGFCDTYDGGESYHLEYSVTVMLTNPYTINDVLSDAKSLSNTWNLADDAQYPWRTDENCFIAPHVSYSESPSPVIPIVASPDNCSYTDPASASYNGSVLGAPLPAGYGQGSPRGVWDFYHDNWYRRFCADDPTPHWAQAAETIGSFTPSYLPANAPRWTPEILIGADVPYIWNQPFVLADATGVFLQKWCETIVERPSYDFARPYGYDKFLIDEDHVYQITSVSGSTVTLVNWDNSAVTSLPFTGADIVGPVTGPSGRGFYAVSAVGTNTVTLGTFKFLAPSDWTSQASDIDTSICFGKLRFPTCPGFGNLLRATPIAPSTYNASATYAKGDCVTDGGTDYVSLQDTNTGHTPGSSPTYWLAGAAMLYPTTTTIQTGEKIDLLAAGLSAIATNQTLTRITDTIGAVAGFSYSSIATLKQICPNKLFDGTTTGQKYYFADNAPKGDFVWRQWTVNLADSSYTHSEGGSCLPRTPCQPQVLLCSPNGETFTNAYSMSFPGTIHNGQLWLGQFEQWMVDPFYQAPHKPCGIVDSTVDEPATLAWSSDDGTCQADTVTPTLGGDAYQKFYALAPFVEARLTKPSNYGNAENESPPDSPFNLNPAVAPPSTVTMANIETTLINAIRNDARPWGIYLRERSCVCAAPPTRADFAAIYETNRTDCD